MRRIAIASDHGGFELKEELKTALAGRGVDLVDLGVSSAAESVDYPDYAGAPVWLYRFSRMEATWRRSPSSVSSSPAILKPISRHSSAPIG